MWIGLAVVVVVATAQAMKSFGVRHEPELPNSKLKLPFRLLCVAICIALAVSGVEAIVFSILGGLFMTEIGFILAGRIPGGCKRRSINGNACATTLRRVI